ncbi:pyruvate ferredoxin oxidoreductase, partial [candidate division KSB3 bacterium]|nr:pyruvate ferredoxin oxidoreductase [candidate division KSB3 bacterium]MBD3325017.1 pyruvate ferredoxin oxidoreductase [candidate division KSB3 bacterium]
MRKVVAITGNGAAAQAMRQINPDVCAAYPITPSTQVMEDFSQFVADGLVNTELITVESEHSAQSACVGAAAAGGRVMNATSANGLALMWEILYIASGSRLPMILTVVNRALSAPINIHADHGDQMGCRDAGWIQFYSENAQEQYDNLIQAVPISEEMNVRLPVMVGMDGFIISHSIERLEMLADEEVTDFLGEYKPHYPLLDIHNPVTYGPVAFHDYYFEHKRQQVEAMRCAKDVILDIGRKYGKLSDREYGFFVPYRLDDAEVAVVAIGSACGTIRVAVDQLRQQGIKAGLLKIRCFRPFPAQEIADALASVKAVAVLDRSDSFGGLGG